MYIASWCTRIDAVSGWRPKGKNRTKEKQKWRKVNHRKWSPFLSQGGQMAPDGVMNESAGCVCACLCTRLCVSMVWPPAFGYLSLKDSLSDETCWNGCRILAPPGCLCDFQTQSEGLRGGWPQDGKGHSLSSSLLTQWEGAKAWD